MTLAVVKIDGPMPFEPEQTDLSRPFWEALKSATWVQSYCNSCNVWRFPPPANSCPTCGSALAWRAAPHTGTLYALTTIHAAPPPFVRSTPYTVGLVDLSHGVRMLTPIVTAETPAIGDRLEVVKVDYRDGVGYGARAAQAPP